MKKLTVSSFFLLPALAVSISHDMVSSILLLLWLFLVIPTCLVYLLDWFRSSKGEGKWGRVAKKLLKIPLALSGVVVFLLGAAMIGWVFYNVYVERLSDYDGPDTIYGSLGIGPLLMGFGSYLIRLASRNDSSAGVHERDRKTDN